MNVSSMYAWVKMMSKKKISGTLHFIQIISDISLDEMVVFAGDRNVVGRINTG